MNLKGEGSRRASANGAVVHCRWRNVLPLAPDNICTDGVQHIQIAQKFAIRLPIGKPEATPFQFCEPDITEQKERRGRRTGWSVKMQIRITRGDNSLYSNQWQHATSSYACQTFDAHYEKNQVISYFLMHHMPSGELITREEYAELQEQYEKLA